MGVMTAIAVAGTVASSAMAANSAKKGRKAASAAASAAAAAFEGVEVPTIEEQQIILQNPELMGQYTPEQVAAMKLGVGALEEVGPQDSTVETQQEALDQLSEMAEGGLTEADMAGRREIGRDVASSARARQKSILNEMAQRGVGGSGMELAAQLKGNQQAMSQEAEATDRLLQQAEAARRNALAQKASISGQMRGQESAETMDKYKARQAIDKFNLGLRHQDAQERNRAQQVNLAARQAHEDQRARTANEMERHNQALRQQQYQNEMQRASGLAGAYQAQGQTAQAGYNQQAQQQAGIGSGIANIFGSLAKPKTEVPK